MVGGYLGAGKTTIISRLLEYGNGDGPERRRIAVLVNDFGQVNIDASRIAQRTDDVIEMSNGCVCCALVDGFVETLDSILQWPGLPDHLVIEPSGVADPMSVAQYAYMPGFELAGVAVAVDMDAVTAQLDDKRIGPSIRRQIERADLILATKIDLADDLIAARRDLEALTAGPVIDVVDGYVDPTILLGLSGSQPDKPAPSDDAHLTGPRLTSTVVPMPAIAQNQRDHLESWLGEAPLSVVRAKGSVQDLADGVFTVDLVGRRVRVIHRPRGSQASDESVLVVLAEPNDETVTEWLAARSLRFGEATQPSTES